MEARKEIVIAVLSGMRVDNYVEFGQDIGEVIVVYKNREGTFELSDQVDAPKVGFYRAVDEIVARLGEEF
jgi:hypothetical protein